MIIHGALPKTPKDVQERHLAKLALAFHDVEAAMHEFDGTGEGAAFGGPEMRLAHQYLETAWLWTREAIERN